MTTRTEVMNTDYTLTIGGVVLNGTQTSMADASADNVAERRTWGTKGETMKTVTSRDSAVTITGDADTSDEFYDFLLTIVDKVGGDRTVECAIAGPGSIAKSGTCDLTNITGVGLPTGEAGSQSEYSVDVTFHWEAAA